MGKAELSQEEAEMRELEDRDRQSSLLLVVGKPQSCPTLSPFFSSNTVLLFLLPFCSSSMTASHSSLGEGCRATGDGGE
jgi:hypothetical protein